MATALGRCDASGYRAVLLGGAAPPTTLPANVVTTYGMTETGSGCVYDGRPLDGVELRIGDGTLGAVGEVLVRGPMLLRAYRDGTDPRLPGGLAPDRRRRAARGRRHPGGLRPDGRGHRHRGREGVARRRSRTSLAHAPVGGRGGGVEAARPRVGRAGGGLGGAPRPGAEPPVLDEVRALVASQVAPYAAPRELVVVDALPRTPGGKVRRADLRLTDGPGRAGPVRTASRWRCRASRRRPPGSRR